MLTEWLKDVARFHEEVTGMPVPERPTQLSPARKAYAVKHLGEELDEFRFAWEDGNLPEQADALVDLIYVAAGRLLEMGIAPGAAFDEVHAANMKRRPGRNAKRGNADHDAVKPEGWQPPDIARWLTLTRGDLDAMAEAKARGYIACSIPSAVDAALTDRPRTRVDGLTGPGPDGDRKSVV